MMMTGTSDDGEDDVEKRERKSGESRSVGREKGSLWEVNDNANAMTGLLSWIWRETSNDELVGLDGETTIPREKREK